MRKIAEVSTRGVSPQATLAASQPPMPLETAGYQKAKAILDSADQAKIASSIRHAGSPATLPQIERLLDKKTSDQPKSKLDKAKSLGGHVLAGGGSGNFVGGKMINLAREALGKTPAASPQARKLELAATAIGASLGGLEYVRKQRAHKKKLATIASPGMALKASRQVGKAAISTGSGPSIQGQIQSRLMGHKFVTPSTKTASVQEITMKKTAGMTPSPEVSDEMKAVVLTREDNKALAHALFGQSYEEVRKRENALVAKLFVQAPGAQTMSPVLEKQAKVFGADVPEHLTNTAIPYAHRKAEYKKYLGQKSRESPTGTGKSALVGGSSLATVGAIVGARSGSPAKGAIIGGAIGTMIGALVGEADKTKIREAKKVLKTNGIDKDLIEEIKYQTDLEKISSVTPALDSLLEKNAKALGLTEAQARFPELLTVKTAARPALSLAKRVTTPTSGPDPVRSMGSGGAA